MSENIAREPPVKTCPTGDESLSRGVEIQGILVYGGN